MKLFRTVTVLLLMGALALLIAGCQKGSERAEVSAEKKAETSGEVKDPAAEVKNEIRQNLSARIKRNAGSFSLLQNISIRNIWMNCELTLHNFHLKFTN